MYILYSYLLFGLDLRKYPTGLPANILQAVLMVKTDQRNDTLGERLLSKI